MIDPKRITLMTKLAAYESGEGKKTLPIQRYFKEHDIVMHVIGTAFTTTLAYVILLFMWLGYQFEELMENIHRTNLLHLGGAVLLIYVVVLAFFVAVSYFVYRAKYNAAQKGLKAYLENLKKLDELYKDDKTKAGYTASIGGVVKYDEVFWNLESD